MKPWQWLVLAGGALAALWLLLRGQAATVASVPATSTQIPQTPMSGLVTGIGSVASQLAALPSIGTNAPHIDAAPSVVSVGWLNQPKIVNTTPTVPTSSTPASAPDSNVPYLTAFPDAGTLFAAAQSGALSDQAIAAAQQALINNAIANGLPVATGPATETRTGRGHF